MTMHVPANGTSALHLGGVTAASFDLGRLMIAAKPWPNDLASPTQDPPGTYLISCPGFTAIVTWASFDLARLYLLIAA